MQYIVQSTLNISSAQERVRIKIGIKNSNGNSNETSSENKRYIVLNE